jgi:hypothetical protein
MIIFVRLQQISLMVAELVTELQFVLNLLQFEAFPKVAQKLCLILLTAAV